MKTAIVPVFRVYTASLALKVSSCTCCKNWPRLSVSGHSSIVSSSKCAVSEYKQRHRKVLFSVLKLLPWRRAVSRVSPWLTLIKWAPSGRRDRSQKAAKQSCVSSLLELPCIVHHFSTPSPHNTQTHTVYGWGFSLFALRPCVFTQRGQRESMEGKVFVVLRLATSRANAGLKLFHEMDGSRVSLESAALDQKVFTLCWTPFCKVFFFFFYD